MQYIYLVNKFYGIEGFVMKLLKIIILIITFFAMLILTGCMNKTDSAANKAEATGNKSDETVEEATKETAGEIDDTMQDYNKLFELNLYSDKNSYKTNEKIKIWATLKYIGENSKMKIWHADPYISFYISDGKDFNTGGTFNTILATTELEKEKLYHFDYSKSGGFSADDPKADFWKKFYSEKDLYLPEGEYTIKVSTAFSLTEKIQENKSSLSQEFKIVVKPG